ncbi:cytochrome C [Geobacter sp. SVR]|uniref:cytochrome C n=1 Tax=Geobacter sp. SVR TaxID=2495594 RepID=UPI00143EF695|nr:cytochrome C [Geobacter sp. SVR]BCS54457.1 cytochrome c [Geobacter sp. SVR]GCF87056.1 cytochrome c [Geobacter sp. SVR]
MSVLVSLRGLVLSAAVTCLLSAAAFGAEPAQKPALSNADCIKCHAGPVADIESNGGAHKTSVTCQDCHTGHPPAVRKVIPECSSCHSGKPHYNLSACMRCHNNPHTPKIIKLSNNITEECLGCHNQQIVKLKQVKSKHSSLACSFCHNVHGKIPQCTQCHKPHSADMTATDCKRCHQAHMPTVVTYPSDTPNKMCAACHTKPAAVLAASDAKHKVVACVTCHRDKHKMVPTCQSCHGSPHPAGMLARFNKCGDCHNTAHNLNHWDPAQKKSETPAAPAKKSKKK